MVTVLLTAATLERDELRVRAAGPGIEIVGERDDFAPPLPRADVILTAGTEMIAAAFDVARRDGERAVVGMISGSEAARALAPCPPGSGWALLPWEASAAEVRGAIIGAAAGLACWPAIWPPPPVGRRTPEGQRSALTLPPATDTALAVPASDGASSARRDRDVWGATAADLHDTVLETLTEREHDVLDLLVVGLSNRAMAERLGISDHTVKFHVASIYGKLGVNGRAAAVRRAIRRGLVRI